MDGKISATGHTCVVLVLNMKRFIHPDDQGRFEELRGSPELVRALQDQWQMCWQTAKRSSAANRQRSKKKMAAPLIECHRRR